MKTTKVPLGFVRLEKGTSKEEAKKLLFDAVVQWHALAREHNARIAAARAEESRDDTAEDGRASPEERRPK